MDHRVERKKQGNASIDQGRLLFSLKTITSQIIKILEEDYPVNDFLLEQREKLINAVKMSELVNGPVGAEEIQSLFELQNNLEQLLFDKMQKSTNEIVDYTSRTKDFKKYNLKNVR